MFLFELPSWAHYFVTMREARRTYWELVGPLLINYPEEMTRERADAELLLWRRSMSFRRDKIANAVPQVSFSAASPLLNLCSDQSKVFMFGLNGTATLIASHVAELVVVEDDPLVCRRGEKALQRRGVANRVSLRQVSASPIDEEQDSFPVDDPLSYKSFDAPRDGLAYREYARTIADYPDNYFDVVIVGGRAQASCFMLAVAKVRLGGTVVVFDTEQAANHRIKDMAEELGFTEQRYRGIKPGERAVTETTFFVKNRERYSLNDLDAKLEKYLDFDKGFFIEAGANNGVRQSNTLFLEATRGWRGMLVEPIPELALDCCRYRPYSITEQVALGSPDQVPGTVTLRFAGLMSLATGGALSVEEQLEHVLAGCEIQKIETYEVEVEIATLSALLDRHGNRKVDFLSLDVEGFEKHVLGGLDFDRHAPRYILIEEKGDGISEFLSKYYDRIDQLTHHDFLYRLRRDQAATSGDQGLNALK